jgi:hypothetical protein
LDAEVVAAARACAAADWDATALRPRTSAMRIDSLVEMPRRVTAWALVERVIVPASLSLSAVQT